MRNEHLLRIWYSAWNADIQRAREAYDEHEAGIARFHVLLGVGRIPQHCRAGSHELDEQSVYWDRHGRWRCMECRNVWQRKNWRKTHPRKAGPKKKISWVRRKEIAELYKAGTPTRDLAAQYKVSKPTILRELRTAGVPIRDRVESSRMMQPKGLSSQLTAEQRTEIVARYNNSETSNALAEDFGVSPMTILRTVKNAGVTPRGKSEALKIYYANRTTKTGRIA
jgi:transposase-like protein